MPQNFVSVESGATALDVYAPGHLGELTEIIDPELVDAVLEDTGVRTQRVRLLGACRGVLRAGPRHLRAILLSGGMGQAHSGTGQRARGPPVPLVAGTCPAPTGKRTAAPPVLDPGRTSGRPPPGPRPPKPVCCRTPRGPPGAPAGSRKRGPCRCACENARSPLPLRERTGWCRPRRPDAGPGRTRRTSDPTTSANSPTRAVCECQPLGHRLPVRRLMPTIRGPGAGVIGRASHHRPRPAWNPPRSRPHGTPGRSRLRPCPRRRRCAPPGSGP